MCNAMKELETEWKNEAKDEANKKAIISMLEFGITKDQILTKYSKEDLDRALASIDNNH